MDSSKEEEVIFEFSPILRVYRDGRKERILNTKFVPPSADPSTGVSSKDVVIQPEIGQSARLYLPAGTTTHQKKKLPLVIYYHGGGFVIQSAFSPTYHRYLNLLASQANAVVVSVDYRKAPEHPVPICYEDSWAALQWVASQAEEEEWLKNYADFNRVFMGGDSAGANIAHHTAVRAAVLGLKIDGVFLIHPFFCGAELIGGEATNVGMGLAGKLWGFVCPLTTGLDDPFINPVKDPNFAKVGCKRILVCVGEKDGLKDRGVFYYDKLGECGWDGVKELMESEGEDHGFHLLNPTCKTAMDLMDRVASFVNQH